MAIALSDNIQVNNSKHVDNRYGPYSSVSNANSSIPVLARVEGLTVGIDSGNGIQEYWYKGGVSDSNLVVKDSSFLNTLNPPKFVFTIKEPSAFPDPGVPSYVSNKTDNIIFDLRPLKNIFGNDQDVTIKLHRYRPATVSRRVGESPVLSEKGFKHPNQTYENRDYSGTSSWGTNNLRSFSWDITTQFDQKVIDIKPGRWFNIRITDDISPYPEDVTYISIIKHLLWHNDSSTFSDQTYVGSNGYTNAPTTLNVLDPFPTFLNKFLHVRGHQSSPNVSYHNMKAYFKFSYEVVKNGKIYTSPMSETFSAAVHFDVEGDREIKPYVKFTME